METVECTQLNHVLLHQQVNHKKTVTMVLALMWSELHAEEIEMNRSKGKNEINRWQAYEKMVLSFTKHIRFRLGPLKPHLERNNSKKKSNKKETYDTAYAHTHTVTASLAFKFCP